MKKLAIVSYKITGLCQQSSPIYVLAKSLKEDPSAGAINTETGEFVSIPGMQIV